jgi:hypothetical protein
MPNFDGTGPMGKEPLTGLGRGGCSKTYSRHNNIPDSQSTRVRNIFSGLSRYKGLYRESHVRGRDSECGRIGRVIKENK